MHRKGRPRDFAGHAQWHAKPWFGRAGRMESAKRSHQGRRTSHPAGRLRNYPPPMWRVYGEHKPER